MSSRYKVLFQLRDQLIAGRSLRSLLEEFTHKILIKTEKKVPYFGKTMPTTDIYSGELNYKWGTNNSGGPIGYLLTILCGVSITGGPKLNITPLSLIDFSAGELLLGWGC